MTDTSHQFYRRLHARGLNQERLASLAGTGRTHLSEVLNNKPGHGHFTRRRLFPHLTVEEVEVLGWGEEYRRWELAQQIKNNEDRRRGVAATSSTGNFVPT